MYDVLISFVDSSDKNAPKGANVYWAGKSTYPRTGYKPPAERIKVLLGTENLFKKPMIAQKEQGPATEVKE